MQASYYIEALKRSETSNLEKWTLDKLMTERKIRDLEVENEELKRALEKRDRQLEELAGMMDGINGKAS